MAPPSVATAVLSALLLPPLLPGDVLGFSPTPSPSTTKPPPPPLPRRSAALSMGYLDDLSPPQPPPPGGGGGGGDDDGGGEPGGGRKRFAPGGGDRRERSGGIPSGRGPGASYLDMMTGSGGGGASSSDDEDDDYDDDRRSDPSPTPSAAFGPSAGTKPAGWSGAYLTDFLTEGGNRDDSRTDVRNLLTQRSVQSFMFLLVQCRDPHSAKWIQEDFLDTGNLLDYHGTGAGFIERFGGTWDTALLAMVRRPKERMIVSAKRRGRGHGGWSRDNPYLEERWMELPIDVDPPSLASRLLSVREQIASEWVEDLDLVSSAGDVILDSYFTRIRSGREGGGGGGGGGSGGVAFERTAVNLVNDKSRFSETASSPYRRANFDLLYNLCTQAAVHRILRRRRAAKGGGERDAQFAFLRDFYGPRAALYFDGDLPYGRADDFVDELLRTSPSLVSTGDGGTGLVDPVGAAEEIIRVRNEVASEWKGLMGRVEEDHTGIRQALLSRQMLGWGASSPDADGHGEGFQ